MPVRGIGRGVLRRITRNVWAGPVGRPPQEAAAGAGSGGQKAAVLFLGRPTPAVRLRDQGAVDGPGHLTRNGPVGVFRLLHVSIRPAPKTIYRDIRKLRPGHY